MLGEPFFQTFSHVNVILLMGRSMQEKSVKTFSKLVLIVLEHDLSVAVGVREGNEIESVHLLQEPPHVCASGRREKHELKIDALDVGLGEAHLVLQ